MQADLEAVAAASGVPEDAAASEALDSRMRAQSPMPREVSLLSCIVTSSCSSSVVWQCSMDGHICYRLSCHLLQITPGEVQPAAGLLLVAGMISSTSAQLVSYPLGLVRTRLQVSSKQGFAHLSTTLGCQS